MNVVKLSDGTIVNLNHMVQIGKTKTGEGLLYLLGMPNAITVSKQDYLALQQIAEHFESKLLAGFAEPTVISVEQSMRLFAELILHFVAFNMAVLNNTVAEYPTATVYNRIANILNQLDSMNNIEESEEEEDEE